jgi:hypothetical protein
LFEGDEVGIVYVGWAYQFAQSFRYIAQTELFKASEHWAE